MVTTPKQSPENAQKTKQWVNEESEKRLKLIKEEIEQRISDLRKRVAEEPNNAEVHVRLGKLLMDDARYPDAIKVFEKIITLTPTSPDVYRAFGECLIRAEEKARAIEVLKRGRVLAEQQQETETTERIEELLQEAEVEDSKGKK